MDLKKAFQVDAVERKLEGISESFLALYRNLPQEFRKRYSFALMTDDQATPGLSLWSSSSFILFENGVRHLATFTIGQITDLALYGLYQFVKQEGDNMDTPKKEEDKSKIINPNAPIPKEKQDEGEIQYPLPNDPKDGFPGA
jgi:hypothetical protein